MLHRYLVAAVMKVCLVAPVSRWRGGMHQYAVHLANNLAKIAEVEAVSYKSIFPLWLYPGDSKSISGEAQLSKRVPVYEILKYYSLLSAYAAAKKINNSIQPDVVEIHWIAPQHGFILIPLMWLLRVRRRLRCKIVLTVHNVFPHESRFFDRLLSRWAFACSDRILVHAEKLRDQMITDFRCDGKKISVIPHGSCTDTAVRLGRKEAREKLGIKQKYVVLFFGFVRPYKGLDELISAFALLDKKLDVALVIAGEFFIDVKGFRNQVEKIGLSRQTYIFPRYIASEEISLFFSAADILVQPYVKFSGQSGVTHTAYLHSLPVVATKVGGLPEIVIDGKTGLLVEPGDSHGLAEALQNLLGDEHRRLEYGLNGKRFLEGNLNWDRVVQLRLDIYAES